MAGSLFKKNKVGFICLVCVCQFTASSLEASGSISVNKNCIEAMNWFTKTEDSISRAKIFYRMLEVSGISNYETGTRFIDSVALFKEHKLSLPEIIARIEKTLDPIFFKRIMPDWPKLAPVEWLWVEPSLSGIVVIEAGESSMEYILENSPFDSEPLWIVKIEIPFPEEYFKKESYFFDKVVSRLTETYPTIEKTDSGISVFIYPSGTMMKSLIENTYIMRSGLRY